MPFSFDDLMVQADAERKLRLAKIADQYRDKGDPAMARLVEMEAAGMFDGAAFPHPPERAR